MRFYFILITIFYLSLNTLFAQQSITDLSDSYFEKQEYGAGLRVLNNALAAQYKTLTTEEIGSIYLKLSWFYQELAGDYDKSLRFLLKMKTLPLNPGHLLFQKAQEGLQKIYVYKNQYRIEDNIIKKMLVSHQNKKQAKVWIKKLISIIKSKKDYYQISTLYYYLGENYFYLNDYYKANRAYLKAMEIHPAIGFYLPVESRQKNAREKWYLDVRKNVSFWIILIMVSYLFTNFIISKIWKRLELKEFLALFIQLILFTLFFLIIVQLIPAIKVLYSILLPEPYFFNFSINSPGSSILIVLFYYGIIGIIGSFLLTLSTKKYHLKWLWKSVNLLLTFLFFVSLILTFFVKNVNVNGFFDYDKQAKTGFMKGSAIFPEQDIEPYILTNPEKYQNLVLNNSSDQYFNDWVEMQYEKIKQLSKKDRGEKE